MDLFGFARPSLASNAFLRPIQDAGSGYSPHPLWDQEDTMERISPCAARQPVGATLGGNENEDRL